MKRHIFALASAVLLGACNATTEPEAPVPLTAGPITTAEAFGAAVVGRTLTIGDNSLVIAADGTLAGTFNDAPLLGTWEFRDGQ